MKNTLKYLSWGAAGLMSGLTLAQVILVSAERAGGSPGGEIIIPIAIPLLLLAGYIVGRDTPRIEDYRTADTTMGTRTEQMWEEVK